MLGLPSREEVLQLRINCLNRLVACKAGPKPIAIARRSVMALSKRGNGVKHRGIVRVKFSRKAYGQGRRKWQSPSVEGIDWNKPAISM